MYGGPIGLTQAKHKMGSFLPCLKVHELSSLVVFELNQPKTCMYHSAFLLLLVAAPDLLQCDELSCANLPRSPRDTAASISTGSTVTCDFSITVASHAALYYLAFRGRATTRVKVCRESASGVLIYASGSLLVFFGITKYFIST